MPKKINKRIAIIDAETDPFKHGRYPLPFVWGFFDGVDYFYFWGKDCTKKLLLHIASYDEPLLILAHNGGKFDFMFFIEELVGDIKLINGRIMKANLGIHELRDSYGILPIPLSESGEKKEIDYSKMELEVREKYKEEILTYLEQDCRGLYALVVAFYDEFGDALTIGGASMKEFKKFHPFENNYSAGFDTFYRQFYFGGRCQCFETGIIKAPLKYVDINSSYPDVMSRLKHPHGLYNTTTKNVTKNSNFVKWRGKNFNAVPQRTKTGLDFTIESGEFYSTIHEFNAGLETGTIAPKQIIEAHEFDESMTFADFVFHFYESRQKAKANGDKFHDIFYKLILNSSYGKFAQSPENFTDSMLLPWPEIPEILYDANGQQSLIQWKMEFRNGKYAIWSKPAKRKTYFNVATAASITGAARASLLIGLSQATRPLYCDTDAIVCTDFKGNIDKKKLGYWDLEKTGTEIAIAGKKLYALMDGDVCVKKAHKGVKLEASDIFKIAQGDTVEYFNPAPSFKLDGSHEFIHRKIQRTGIV